MLKRFLKKILKKTSDVAPQEVVQMTYNMTADGDQTKLKVLDGPTLGLYNLLQEYYMYLPEDERGRLSILLMTATGRQDIIGKMLDKIVIDMTPEQMLYTQQLIESEYKFIKH